MKYRDLRKEKIWSNHKLKRKYSNSTLWKQKIWFLQGDIRWMFFVNQWIQSGKRYVIDRVIKKSKKYIRSEHLCSAWLMYRSAVWGSRMLLDMKTKKFGRKQYNYPVVIKGATVYSKPMLYLRKLINNQSTSGYFWLKWNNGVLSTSIGTGPLQTTLENKYIQLAKLQNLWSKKMDIVDEGKQEWTNRLII